MEIFFCAVIFKGITASRVRFGTWLLQKLVMKTDFK